MDWSNPVASAFSGAFGLLGAGLQYKYNKKLAEQQNQYNIDMWNMQNEYNSPANQMKRYEQAGLNPNLIYGQGTPGNAASSPEQVTPAAPDLSPALRELSQAFNIEGLKTAIANRKKAQAEARIANTQADDAAAEYAGKQAVGHSMYVSDSGQLLPLPDRVPLGTDGRYVYDTHGASTFYLYKTLLDNYRNNSLLVPRAALIGSQTLLNQSRRAYLAPQISMANYEAKHYPWTFWLGNARTGAQAVSEFLPWNWIPKLRRPPIRYNR